MTKRFTFFLVLMLFLSLGGISWATDDVLDSNTVDAKHIENIKEYGAKHKSPLSSDKYQGDKSEEATEKVEEEAETNGPTNLDSNAVDAKHIKNIKEYGAKHKSPLSK